MCSNGMRCSVSQQDNTIVVTEVKVCHRFGQSIKLKQEKKLTSTKPFHSQA